MNILLVDDDAGFNFLNSRLLQRMGVIEQLYVCENGLGALQLLHRLHQENTSIPQMILLDIKMPELDGFGFLESLQNMEQGIANSVSVAMLSSSVNPEDKMKSYAYPQVVDFIEKPLDAGKFFITLQKVRNKQKNQRI